MTCYINLTGRQARAIIDAQDYDEVSQYSWHWLDGYAATWIDDKLMYMRWLILGFYKWGFLVTTRHINGVKLDNRRHNLEVVVEMMSSRFRNNHPTSRQKGVNWRTTTNNWQVTIRVYGRAVYVGTFGDEEEAIKAYREAAVKYNVSLKSRYKGVYFDKKSRKWRAQIWMNGKQNNLGVFDDEEEAAEAYREAKSDRL